MRNKTAPQRSLTLFRTTLTALALFTLGACSSDDNGDGEDAYLNLYNASVNSPAIFLTVDEDLDSDDDDEIETTYSSVRFGESSGYKTIPSDSYYIELAWQEEDSAARSDLTLVYQEQTKLEEDTIRLLVLAGDILDPSIVSYDIPVIDDDEDDDLDLFNLRVLNISTSTNPYDIYLSDADETFNEAELIGSYSPQELSENQKFEQEQYIFYVTEAGSDEVVYQSNEVTFSLTSQYVIALRDNTGVGSAPVLLDLIASGGTTNLPDDDSEARVRYFNGMQVSELMPEYTGAINISTSSDGSDLDVSALATNSFSEPLDKDNGDYSVRINDSQTDERLFANQLLSLPENTYKTIFYYIQEEAVDEDDDGNVDENDDGIVDAYKAVLRTLETTTLEGNSIYEHQVKVVNLVDNTEFSRIATYFVKSDEIISTAEATRSVVFGNQSSLYLRNNTYQVFAVAEIDGTEIILTQDELTLDQDSNAMFMILVEDENAENGVSIQWADQVSE
ncbi:hypothetical protein ISG33_04520 [Glaciecola sp. MH2013]|uniref:hypothetical protein n=1 Tax=Glaciecola sp. MH2013 TaxID=2785524 RepID=UPI0018A050CA|nr:hypothetical protein [Glaciecola sp. MH2013]MBF7072661.1 hypothetical protein [Glaciecola sp. MH2013]